MAWKSGGQSRAGIARISAYGCMIAGPSFEAALRASSELQAFVWSD
jgi:hypothetical protein